MNKKGILIAMIVGGGILGIVAIIALGAFVLLSARAPHSFTTEQMSAEYLAEKTQLGPYMMVEDFPLGNPIASPDGLSHIAYYSPDGAFTEETVDVANIIVSSTTDELESVLENIANAECEDNSTSSNGEVNGTKYYQGTCGEASYFLFTDGGNWIAFTNQGGADNLEQMINAY